PAGETSVRPDAACVPVSDGKRGERPRRGRRLDAIAPTMGETFGVETATGLALDVGRHAEGREWNGGRSTAEVVARDDAADVRNTGSLVIQTDAVKDAGKSLKCPN